MDANTAKNIIQKTFFYEDAEDKDNFKYEDYEVIHEDKLKEKAQDYLWEYLDNWEENITDSFIKTYLVIDYYDFVKRVLDFHGIKDVLGLDYNTADEIWDEDDNYYYVLNKNDIMW